MTKQNITSPTKLLTTVEKANSSFSSELRDLRVFNSLDFDHQLLLKPQAKPPLSVSAQCLCEEADIMDFDLRASIHSVKHLSAVQAARLHSDNYSVFHCTDMDDDAQTHFRCPFCDFEIQVSVLCSSLEEGHCADLKNVVCPVCEQNLGKDVIRQFTHPSSRKWMSKSEKSRCWSGNSATRGKKLAAMGNKQESLLPDPLLSPFICNVPVPNSNDIHPDEDSSSSNEDLDIPDAKRSGTDVPHTVDKQDRQERRLRASFVQTLVLSTIFDDICS